MFYHSTSKRTLRWFGQTSPHYLFINIRLTTHCRLLAMKIIMIATLSVKDDLFLKKLSIDLNAEIKDPSTAHKKSTRKQKIHFSYPPFEVFEANS